MAISTNPIIQKLLDEVDRIEANDDKLEEKLNLIAIKIAEEQRNVKARLTGTPLDELAPIDPAEGLACEGCQ